MSEYRYSLALTSQFPFCAIPFRLDTYSTCQFACSYCFASARGGAVGTQNIRSADAGSFSKRLERVNKGQVNSVIDEFLLRRIPLHFGGMSDPFMPLEATRRITLSHLKTLSEHNYPTIISTKGNIITNNEYLSFLKKGNFVVQISFSGARESIASQTEPGAPSLTERLSTIKTLSNSGIPTMVRLQPIFPKQILDAYTLIEQVALSGARHIAVEHLKLPIEKDWSHKRNLNAAVGYDLLAYYLQVGATRVGREWILPVIERIPTILILREHTHHLGMTFGAADNDLLHWSDGGICCNEENIDGFGNALQFNFTTAVRRGMRSGIITFNSIHNEWRPSRSISQYVNSHSRKIQSETIEHYLQSRWNGAANGPSLTTFYGVHDSGRVDRNGYHIYTIEKDCLPPSATNRNTGFARPGQ